MISLVSFGVRVPFRSAIARDLRRVGRILGISQGEICEIYFCDAKRMREVNRTFRNKDYPTTVVSIEVPGGFLVGSARAIGEVYVCPEEILRKGVAPVVHTGSVGFYQKLMYYIVHGVMHVRGYDHDRDWFSRKRMEQTELSLWYRICHRV